MKRGIPGEPGALQRVFALPFTRALLALMVVLLLGMAFNADGAFFKLSTHQSAWRQVSVYGILACGMTMVIITGGIDLAVGSVLGLMAVLFSLFTIRLGVPWPLAIPLCLLLGAACGGVSGGLVALFRIQPFIATLAMMVFARGLAKRASGGVKIANMVEQPDGSYGPATPIFGMLDTKILGDNLAVVTVIFLICVLISWLLLARFRPGRYLYAIGGNEEAARLSGVPVGWAKVLAYAMSGLFSAVAGICQAAQETHGDPEAGATYELTAIAIVVIGGTSLMGGRGSILLTLLGALTIGYLEKILSINAVADDWRLMLTGGIIVAAVLLQRSRR